MAETKQQQCEIVKSHSESFSHGELFVAKLGSFRYTGWKSLKSENLMGWMKYNIKISYIMFLTPSEYKDNTKVMLSMT